MHPPLSVALCRPANLSSSKTLRLGWVHSASGCGCKWNCHASHILHRIKQQLQFRGHLWCHWFLLAQLHELGYKRFSCMHALSATYIQRLSWANSLVPRWHLMHEQSMNLNTTAGLVHSQILGTKQYYATTRNTTNRDSLLNNIADKFGYNILYMRFRNLFTWISKVVFFTNSHEIHCSLIIRITQLIYCKQRFGIVIRANVCCVNEILSLWYI